MSEQVQPPPSKKIRIDPSIHENKDIQATQWCITKLSDDLLFVILSFLSYPQSIISLCKTCKLFKELIDKHPTSCIKHFTFTTAEHNIASNKLLNHISKLNKHNHNNDYQTISSFISQFSNLKSLELLTTLYCNDVMQCYIRFFLKPIRDKLLNLIVNTWEDAALSRTSFNFDNIIFNNVRSVEIKGKDTKYPFHITQYTPNVSRLTLSGCNVLFYSLYRMLFDTHSSLQHLSEFYIYGGSMSHLLAFYESKYNNLLRANMIVTYNSNLLQIDANAYGTLQLFHYMIAHSLWCNDKELNFVRLIILYNRKRLQRLAVNYDVFYNSVCLDDETQIRGMNEFIEKRNSKQIHLPNLEHLTLTMIRISAGEYGRIHDGMLYYKLIAPQLRCVELLPGVCCWHDSQAIIPFLSALLGDQLYKLDTIKIQYLEYAASTQRQYLESSIQQICDICRKEQHKINIILQTDSGSQQWST